MFRLIIGFVLGFTVATYGVDATFDLMRDGLNKAQETVNKVDLPK